MVEFSNAYGCWLWRCEWGHMAYDFEGEQEALEDFQLHACDRHI